MLNVIDFNRADPILRCHLMCALRACVCLQ